MNKRDLINKLQTENGLSKDEASAAVNIFFDKISRSLAAGHRVEIRGLCSIHIKQFTAYTGRNPMTGKKVKVKRKKLPFFKPGKKLKERVDR